MVFDPVMYALSKSNAEYAKQEVLEKTNWRYLGRFDVSEDVSRFDVTEDANGKPFNLKRLMIQGRVAPNAAGATGYINAHFNGKAIGSVVYGSAMGEGVIGSAFRQTVEVRGGKLFCEQALLSYDTKTLGYMLQSTSGTSSYVQNINNMMELESITRLRYQGWQDGVIGAGSYFELWGIDA